MTEPETTQPRAQPVDYDNDLDRFLTNQTATRLFSTSGDVHEPVAEHLQRQHSGGRVLDLGGGNGLLARHLGHATAAFTLQTYTHVIPGMDESAAATVAALILATEPGTKADGRTLGRSEDEDVLKRQLAG